MIWSLIFKQIGWISLPHSFRDLTLGIRQLYRTPHTHPTHHPANQLFTAVPGTPHLDWYPLVGICLGKAHQVLSNRSSTFPFSPHKSLHLPSPTTVKTTQNAATENNNLCLPSSGTVTFIFYLVCYCFIWYHFMGNRWGNSVRLYFGGLQNHCRWWLQPWN